MSDNSLILLDEARTRLAKVASAKEAKTIRDQAAAMEHWSRQQKGALESANYASEIKVRAERRIGELLAAVPRPKPAKRGQGRPPKSTPNVGSDSAQVVKRQTALREAIEEAEITPRMAEDCQKLAAIPEPLFEAAVVTMQTDPEIKHRGVSTAGMLRVHRESDGSIESIKKAVNKEVSELPETRYSAVIQKFGKALVELEELSRDTGFVKFVRARKGDVTVLREWFKSARRIEKEILP